MNYRICVFKYLEQKVMYLPDVNYYFGIKDDYDIKLGDYELSGEAMLAIAKENDPKEYEVFTNSSIEERMNKINTYNFEEIKEEVSRGQFTLCLHPSRRCNLNCKYCFRESEYLGNEQLSFEVAKDAIDFFVDIYAPRASKYVVDLSGSGEPLLQIDLIKQIVEYCKNKRNIICKNIEVMLCTNLTLLTPEIVDYLDAEPTIILGASIDGDQITNDNNRVYTNGRGTYDDIINGLKMFKHKKLGLAVTLTPLNQNIYSVYNHLINLENVDCVSMRYIRCFDNSKYDFENFNSSHLFSEYESICSRIICEIEKGNSKYYKMILKGADYFGKIICGNLIKGTQCVFSCDAGKNRIAVNSVGDIYACSVMNGENEFNIGNIYNGIQENRMKKFMHISRIESQECINCNYNLLCGGECHVNSYITNCNLYSPYKKMCKLRIELNKLSMAFISRIKSKNFDLYKLLIDFIFEVHEYESAHPEIWAIMYFLKKHNIIVNYQDVYNDIDPYSNVIKEIVSIISKYKRNVSIYKISLEDNIKVPAIAIINKTMAKKFDYLFIEEFIEGNIVCCDYFVNYYGYYKIPFEDFINSISDIIIC